MSNMDSIQPGDSGEVLPALSYLGDFGQMRLTVNLSQMLEMLLQYLKLYRQHTQAVRSGCPEFLWSIARLQVLYIALERRLQLVKFAPSYLLEIYAKKPLPFAE